MRARDYSGAVRLATKAIEADAKDGFAYGARALAEWIVCQNERAAARAACRNATIADAGSAIAYGGATSLTYYVRAEARREAGDYQPAIDDYTRMLAITPGDEDAYSGIAICEYQLAKTAGSAGRKDHLAAAAGALGSEGAALEKKLSDPARAPDPVGSARLRSRIAEVYASQADIFETIDRYPESIAAAQTSLRYVSGYGYAFGTLALAQYENDAAQAAVDTVNRALTVTPPIEAPDRAKLLALRGLVERDRSQNDAALADAKAAVALDPSAKLAWAVQMDAAYAKDDYALTIASADALLKLGYRTATLYVKRGASKYFLGTKPDEYKAAIADEDSALALDPKSAQAFKYRGAAKYEIGDYAGAIADETSSIGIDATDDTALLYRGAAKYGADQYAGAIADLTAYLKSNPQSSWALRLRGASYNRLDDTSPKLGRADLEASTKINPKNVFAWSELGYSNYLLDDYPAAIKAFDQALAIDKNDGFSLRNRGASNYYAANYAAALADENAALTVDPADRYALRFRGAAKYYLDDYDGSIADETKAIELSLAQKVEPPSFAYRVRGSAYFYKGDLAASIRDETEALRILPTNGAALDRRAAAYLGQGHNDLAVADATSAIAIDATDDLAFRLRAQARYALGNYQAAVDDFQKAIALVGASSADSADNYTLLGDTYMKLNRVPDARAAYQKALQLKPGDPDVLKRLNTISTTGMLVACSDCSMLGVGPANWVPPPPPPPPKERPKAGEANKRNQSNPVGEGVAKAAESPAQPTRETRPEQQKNPKVAV